MLEKIAQVVKNYKSDDSLTVAEDTSFEELGFDSLDTVQLIMDIEEEFSVSIEPDKSIKTVADLIAVIEAAKEA